MTELETIARAQMYLEKLANGINPLTGEEVAENDIVNNVRISRCMFYVSNLLKEIVDNKGKYKAEMPDRVPFTITPEQIQNFEFSDNPISISEITKRFNALIDTIHVKEIKYTIISEWLTQSGMLTEITVNNKTRKRPSSSGINIGIIVEERMSKYGTPYEGVFYSLNAQRFIVDNIYAIIALQNQKEKK